MNLKRKRIAGAVTSAAGCAALLAGYLLSAGKTSHYLGGLIVMLAAVALYFFDVFMNGRDWLDLQCVFTGSWLFTIGMAALRLCRYQKIWEGKTWALFAGALVAFTLGNLLMTELFAPRGDALCRKAKGTIGRAFETHEDRLFSIALAVTLISLVCFVANILYKGYVPYFSDAKDAYITFYSKLHIPTVAGTAASGLCYYCIRKCNLPRGKKFVMAACIVYSVLVMPILVVSRGTFIIAAVSLTGCVFYLHNKKLLALVLCLVITFAGYELGTHARDLGQEDLQVIFEPESHEISLGGKTTVHIKMSGRDAFLYSYFTVSHDNVDAAVKNATQRTHGARQLVPFNKVLRIPAIDRAANLEYYTVKENLNTNDLIGLAYYDFGAIGACVWLFFLSMVLTFVACVRNRKSGPFALLFNGYCIMIVMLSFFAAWMSVFTLWLLVGVVALMAILACYTPKRQRVEKSAETV